MEENKNTTSPLDGKTVMWVEDDPFLSGVISQKLSKKNCKFLYARDSIQVFNTLKTETPDIIVLDILLPGQNGFEILEQLKADEKTKSIPVVILSNFGQEADVKKGQALGAEKFLVKAIYTLEEIFDELSKYIK